MSAIIEDSQIRKDAYAQSKVPIIRTPVQIVKLLKEVDPDTAITVSGLYRLVHDGKIRATMVGNRYLLDYEEVLAYYGGERVV